MSKKNRQNIILENIEIIDIASEGKAITKGPSPQPTVSPNEDGEKKGGLIVFVKGAIPGDVVDLEIFRKKKNYAEAKILKIHKYSEKRNKSFCNHFGTCGGCIWQNLKYEEQLFYKQKQVVDAFVHIAKIDQGEERNSSRLESVKILPIIPSKQQTYYRNKLEFAFSNKKWLTIEEIRNSEIRIQDPALGFHISGLFDKVLDIEHCHLQPAPSNEIRLAIKDYALKNDLTFFDFRKQEGFLRNLIIRNSALGELMVIVVFGPSPAAHKLAQTSTGGLPPEGKGESHTQAPNQMGSAHKIRPTPGELVGASSPLGRPGGADLLNHIAEKFPEITSLMYINNPKKNDTIYDLDVHLFKGRSFINEKLDDLIFKISPKSFFQTNTAQALELYRAVRDFAQIKNTDIVYDFYTGTGTIANFIARDAKKVIGIESISDAIEDAKENSGINNISNTVFFSGDIKNILNDDFILKNGKPGIIITDPPRAGMDEKVIKKILEIEPERIVYVSCNPATQARDVAILSSKYELKIIQPVDMFPHTHHVENVAVMERKIIYL